jgi:hypothetical protein
MATKTPLAIVNEKFGEKAKLVEAIEKLTGDALWIARTNEAKGLAHVSNAKLLRLHATFTAVKEKFGTRDKLVEAILEIEKRGKDAGYKARLQAWPVPRLFDAYKSAHKRSEAAKAPPKTRTRQQAAAKPAPKAPVAKKTAKKTAGKKSKKG